MDGFQYKCKECKKREDKLNYSLNQKQILERAKIYRKTTNSSFSIYKGRAKQYNREFLLSKDEFASLVSKTCYYCNEFPQGKELNRYRQN